MKTAKHEAFCQSSRKVLFIVNQEYPNHSPRLGWANAAFPAEELEARVLEVAKRITGVPPDLVQLNKRVVHRQMEIMGLHTGIRVGSELCALGTHQKSMHEFLAKTREKGLTAALQQRDEPFGDYRTKDGSED